MSESGSSHPQFLTIKEFAAAYKFSVDMIEHRCKDNTMPHVRVGRSIRIPHNALEILMAEQGWEWKGK